MGRREILTYPHPLLRKRAIPVYEVNKIIRDLIDDMVETMYSAPGIGLAAPQVGISLRLIVVDVTRSNGGDGLIHLINPEILWSDGSIIQEEGCLSIPGINVEMERKEKIRVSGLDRNGKKVEINAEGLLAVAIQHEVDHLDGRLIIDRISPLKREIYRRKMKKALMSKEAGVNR
jgi:peptide deformylase